MRISFRFRWIPFVAALLAAVLGVSLGEWQRGRAVQKESIAAAIQSRSALAPMRLKAAPADGIDSLEYRRVILRGSFLADWPVYLDNRPYGGRGGFYLAMPFSLVDGGVVLVLRGWLPRDPRERTRVPLVHTPTGEIEIEGRIRRDAGQVLQLGKPEKLQPGAIVQNLTPSEWSAASGQPALPFIIEQTGMPGTAESGLAGGPALVRDWPQPSFGADKHRAYAFQWYALAATALLFFLATGIRRGTS